MVNEEHYAWLNKGVPAWNKWRLENLGIIPDLSEANLSEANLSEANLRRANLRRANLIGANLIGANLIGADLSGVDLRWANLRWANLRWAKLRWVDLRWANLRGVRLIGADLRSVDLRGANLSLTNLISTDLSEVDLSEAKLIGADLIGANLSGADLIGANLSGANLSGADLSRTQALNTDFTNTKFTSACLENWNINSATKLNNIDCQYMYLRYDKQERRPSKGEFAPGEFTKLLKKALEALETFDLIFNNEVDWKAFAYSFRKIQIENESSKLTIRKIEIIDDIVLVEVNISERTEKTQFHNVFFKGYEFAKKELEPQHQARLADKDKEINRLVLSFDKAYEKLGEVPKLMAKQLKVQQNFHASVYGVAGNKDALNVSRVCQEGLEAAIRIEELKREKSPNMETLIERLRIEKEQDVAEWKEQGVIKGKKDALNLTYKEFKKLESKQSIADDWTYWIEEDYFEDEEAVDKDAFFQGWLEGALSVWDEAKESF